MINRCIGCYYHDNKENVCTHGSPIFLDDVCTDYQDSEFVMQIRAEVIDDVLKKVEFEEMWLFACYKQDGCKYSNKDINIAFGGIKNHLKKLKEQK